MPINETKVVTSTTEVITPLPVTHGDLCSLTSPKTPAHNVFLLFDRLLLSSNLSNPDQIFVVAWKAHYCPSDTAFSAPSYAVQFAEENYHHIIQGLAIDKTPTYDTQTLLSLSYLIEKTTPSLESKHVDDESTHTPSPSHSISSVITRIVNSPFPFATFQTESPHNILLTRMQLPLKQPQLSQLYLSNLDAKKQKIQLNAYINFRDVSSSLHIELRSKPSIDTDPELVNSFVHEAPQDVLEKLKAKRHPIQLQHLISTKHLYPGFVACNEPISSKNVFLEKCHLDSPKAYNHEPVNENGVNNMLISISTCKLLYVKTYCIRLVYHLTPQETAESLKLLPECIQLNPLLAPSELEKPPLTAYKSLLSIPLSSKSAATPTCTSASRTTDKLNLAYILSQLT